MKFLLDTNIVIYSFAEPHKLSDKVRKILDFNEGVYFSVLCLWEISILFNKDRLKMPYDLKTINNTLKFENGFSYLNIDLPSIMAFNSLPNFKNHKDPFDRMLIASAIAHDMTLITSNQKFAQYKDCKVITV